MRNRSLKGLVMAGLAAVVFLGGFQPATARAANIPYSLSMTPFAGGYVFEGNQHITNKAVYGISAGYNFTEHWGLEATYTFSRRCENHQHQSDRRACRPWRQVSTCMACAPTFSTISSPMGGWFPISPSGEAPCSSLPGHGSNE